MSMDGHKFFQPHFKPDYNPDLLCTVNYICHLFVVDKKIIDQIGMLRKEYDGAQDYDFIFRCIEAVKPEEIYLIILQSIIMVSHLQKENTFFC